MRLFPANTLCPALPARARAACGLLRWLLVLLLVFDLVATPWHTHHHDNGIDGTAMAAMAHAALAAEAHADASDERPSWGHATTVLRIEAGPALAAAGGTDCGPPPAWPTDHLAPAAQARTRLAVASSHALPRPAHRSLPPPPQAPPRRA